MDRIKLDFYKKLLKFSIIRRYEFASLAIMMLIQLKHLEPII